MSLGDSRKGRVAAEGAGFDEGFVVCGALFLGGDAAAGVRHAGSWAWEGRWWGFVSTVFVRFGRQVGVGGSSSNGWS